MCKQKIRSQKTMKAINNKFMYTSPAFQIHEHKCVDGNTPTVRTAHHWRNQLFNTRICSAGYEILLCGSYSWLLYTIICNWVNCIRYTDYRLRYYLSLTWSSLSRFIHTCMCFMYDICFMYDDACVLCISVNQTHNVCSRNGWTGEISTLMCFWYWNVGAFLEGKAFPLAFNTLQNFHFIHQTNKSLLICSSEWKKTVHQWILCASK